MPNSTRPQPLDTFFDRRFAERASHDRAHHQPHHFVEKAVPVELDCDARTRAAHLHRINCPYRTILLLAATRRKSSEIVRAHEAIRRRLQDFEIEPRRYMPGASVLKGLQDRSRPDSVAAPLDFEVLKASANCYVGTH